VAESRCTACRHKAVVRPDLGALHLGIINTDDKVASRSFPPTGRKRGTAPTAALGQDLTAADDRFQEVRLFIGE
jgi:hypothetical protein